MRILVATAALVVCTVSGAPQGYSYNSPSTPIGYGSGCGKGTVSHADGSCVSPKVTRQVYVYTAPEQPHVHRPPPKLPPPEIIHQVLFVRVADQKAAPDPIVLGPPRYQQVVYVLHKKQDDQEQKVITVPAHPPSSPEVYFVDLEHGGNTILPDGVDLKTALNSATSGDAQVISGSGGFGGIGGGYGGGVGGDGGGGSFSLENDYIPPSGLYSAP